MNKKSLSLLLGLPLLLTSCGPSSGSTSQEEDISYPTVSEVGDGDGYVDKLPTASQDGAILHCFNWTYNQIKANLTTIANAGFKSVQVSPVQQPKSGGAFWWAYYQPVSLSIATSSMLGTKDELKSLCDEAEKLGVGVIADIVFNHLGNAGETAKESDGTPSVSKEVEKFEPEIYALRNDAANPTFHHNMSAKGSGAVTQFYPYGNLPDLNTAHPLVQEKCYGLLKECIDVGIDGFRFDAAKHIETPDDPDYASDFWVNTLGKAKTYYKNKTNADLFAYGEILNDVDGGRKLSDYTKHMYVTDSGYIGNQVTPFISANAKALSEAQYAKNTDPNNLITWAESHDTYVEAKSHEKIKRMRKMWTVLSSRNGSRGLYFARPNENLDVAKIGDYSFEDEIIASANRFHNRFVGGSEKQDYQDSFYINVRNKGNAYGAVVVSLGKDSDFKTSKLNGLPNGVYFDQVSGNPVAVEDGKARFSLPDEGIAILTTSKNVPHPYIDLKEREGGFVGSKEVNVSVKNASDAYYTINGKEAVHFKDSTTIIIGDDVNENKEVVLKVYAVNGDFKAERNATFKKVDLIPGGFNVVNFNFKNFEDYEVYLWSWIDGVSSKWNKNYKIEGKTILVDVTGLDGFLIGLFPKGHEISVPSQWDESIIKQSSDIKGEVLKQGFFDASGF